MVDEEPGAAVKREPDQIVEAMRILRELQKKYGDELGAVMFLTGLSYEKIEELGGLKDQPLEEVLAAYDRGIKGVTAFGRWATGWVYEENPCGLLSSASSAG